MAARIGYLMLQNPIISGMCKKLAEARDDDFVSTFCVEDVQWLFDKAAEDVEMTTRTITRPVLY